MDRPGVRLALVLVFVIASPAWAGVTVDPAGDGSAYRHRGAASSTAPAPSTRRVTIDNNASRLDVNGNIINAHDGHIVYSDGVYWMFGTRYPDCVSTGPNAQGHCGWGNGPSSDKDCWGNWGDNDFAAYSSTDLVAWELRNPQILPSHARPRGTYFRPKVLHAPQNAVSEQWVLWGNYVDMAAHGDQPDASYFTAVAARPQGPYVISAWNITVGTKWHHNGDFNLFQDDNGSAYIAYHSYGCPAWPGVQDTPCVGVDGSHAVDLLSADYTTSTGKTSGLFDIRGSEASVMYKRGGAYYIITATGCGFCTEGSGAMVFVASSPLGPYTNTEKDLNPCVHSDDPKCGLLKNGVSTTNAPHIIPAQQSFVFKLPVLTAQGKEQWLWGGDRWNSTPDNLKSHEFQTWVPFEFGDDGLPLPLRNIPTFEVEV